MKHIKRAGVLPGRAGPVSFLLTRITAGTTAKAYPDPVFFAFGKNGKNEAEAAPAAASAALGLSYSYHSQE